MFDNEIIEKRKNYPIVNVKRKRWEMKNGDPENVAWARSAGLDRIAFGRAAYWEKNGMTYWRGRGIYRRFELVI